MFTGIVTDVGTVVSISGESEVTVRIAATGAARDIEPGASIACDGVCLTAVRCGGGAEPWFDANASQETLSRTNIRFWRSGTKVNLERPLKVGDELGGHIVSGHVDGTAEVTGTTPDGDCRRIRLRPPEGLLGFIASKGSVALNGVSLTVNEVDNQEFGVNLIPFTLAETNWSEAGIGDRINIEIDILARYVSRLRQREH